MSNKPETVVRALFDRMAEGGHIIDAFDEYLADDFVWENSGLPAAPDKVAATAMMTQFVETFAMHRLVIDLHALAVTFDDLV